MFSISLLAIIPIITTPPATANQQNCDYSVMVEHNTYKCYTSDEYNAIKQQEQKQTDEINSEILGFLSKYWWVIGIGAAILFIIWDVKSGDDIEYIGY